MKQYEALIAGVELFYTTGEDSVRAFSDSQLIISQLNGEYEMKDGPMAAYVRRVWEAIQLLKHCSISHMPRLEIDKRMRYQSWLAVQKMGS